MKVTRDEALAGGSVEDVLTLLARFPADTTVALVGHEPQLSELLAHLVGSNDADRLAFKKGGVAVVDLPEGTRSVGVLSAFLPPGVLRAAR
jgi:phosphohistidine phosphatase SixA